MPVPPSPASGESDDSDDLLHAPALDHFVLLRGVFPDGSDFETRFPVSEKAINVTIGRGGADLVVESPAVSRRHASLNGSRSELTLTDLGSSNGTSINGVPVLEDEIMYLEPGDTIVLGNVRCQLEILPREAEKEEDG